MSLWVTAGLLALLSTTLLGPVSVRLAGSTWVSRAPRAAVALWQAIGVSACVAAIGAGLCVAIARFHDNFGGGMAALLNGLIDGHPLRGLGLPDALGLTLAADLGVVLLCVMGATMARTVTTRARHRHILNVIAGSTPSVPGAVMLDHPHAVAYCLPGIRPRIVISAGTLRVLTSEELSAVIAHERGHAHERHGLIMLPMAGLRDLFGWIPYASLAPPAIGALLEMAADDHAARRHRPETLASALVRMATPHAAPACTFGLGTLGVSARVTRLLREQRTSRRTALVAGAGAAGLVALPVVVLLVS
jgi:hypothetical protein